MYRVNWPVFRFAAQLVGKSSARSVEPQIPQHCSHCKILIKPCLSEGRVDFTEAHSLCGEGIMHSIRKSVSRIALTATYGKRGSISHCLHVRKCRALSSEATPLLEIVTFRQRIKEYWESGTLLICASWLCLLPFGVEYLLSIQNTTEAKDMVAEFQQRNQELEQRWKEEREQYLQQDALFECVICVETKLDGYKLFPGDIGDVVEVLQEVTGPGSLYNMVRGKGDKSHLVGWYATQYLEKVEPKMLMTKKGWLWN